MHEIGEPVPDCAAVGGARRPSAVHLPTVPRFIERTDVESWGRVVRRPQHVARPRFRDELAGLLSGDGRSSRLALGLGRSYGDSCLNSSGALIDMTGLDRLISFDPSSGRLRAEAGISLSQILALVAPLGWFVPTTPGTRFVTLGGAVANDVHGKNHHRIGSFGCHVVAIGLLRGSGEQLTLTPGQHPVLFAATIGGLGLTGVIEWVEIALAKVGSSFLRVENIPYESLDAFWSLAQESSESFEHTVAWIDCTSKRGRGIFSRANWSGDGVYEAHRDDTWKAMPFDAPAFALNRLSVSAFNALYHKVNGSKSGPVRQHYAPFFYPLDAVLNWNRFYGWRGMYQYQCVIPKGPDRSAMPAILEAIARSGQASFLAVLKTFGDVPSPGLLSFPRAGTTLALDFPNRGAETLALMGRLDRIVHEAGGALYPAKDGRMTAELFRASFPRWGEFARQKDPSMSSDFWRRVAE